MEDIIDFFLKTGEVKHLKQRGLVLRGVEDPARVGGHSFREAIMAWTLTQHDTTLDCSHIIKLTLLRDLASGYSGDPTPYEPLLWQSTNDDTDEIFKKWIRLSKKEKETFLAAKLEQQHKGLQELTKYLPESTASEMQDLWKEYATQNTQEARFVYQLHFLENFIQSLEYWKKDKNFPIDASWHQMKELITHPILLELLEGLDKKFYGKTQ
jgi:5'-deoxynucleotidase YfbR-like HD superfamily hydrolase